MGIPFQQHLYDLLCFAALTHKIGMVEDLTNEHSTLCKHRGIKKHYCHPE